MTKRRMTSSHRNSFLGGLPGFEPARGSHADPVHRQLYRWLRQAILDGKLPAGTRLPATRTLASEYSLSRNTVVCAFEHLAAEGFLTGRIGSGTVVTGATPASTRSSGHIGRPTAKPELSDRGARLSSEIRRIRHDDAPRLFEPGVPDVSEFPRSAWSRLLSRRSRTLSDGLFGYGHPGGFGPLRELLAAYLAASRGVRCTPEQVLIVPTAQAALEIATRMLTNDGDSAWLEAPGYAGALAAFITSGMHVQHIPVDDEGVQVQRIARLGARSRIGYVTPSHQYPTGVTLSLARRSALLDWTEERNAWVIEDDYDSEFRYAQGPIASIQGLVPTSRVIYVGSFSKALFPGLRIAYLVVPAVMAPAFRQAIRQTGLEPSLPLQAALHDFIDQGMFSRHVRRMRAVYAVRHAELLRALREHLRPLGEPIEAAGGLQILFRLAPGLNPAELAVGARHEGFGMNPIAAGSRGRSSLNGLLFGIGTVGQAPIADSVRRLARCLRSARAPR